MTSQLSRSGLSNCPWDQVRAKVVCCKSLTTLSPDQWLLNHQYFVFAPDRLPPTANWEGDFIPLQRCSRCILQPPLTGLFLSCWSTLIWHLPFILAGKNYWFPYKYVSVPIWTHTYISMVNLQPYTHIYPHIHTLIELSPYIVSHHILQN